MQIYGTWYSYLDNKIGQGREAVYRYLENSPDVLSKIETEIRDHYGLKKLKHENIEQVSQEEKAPKKRATKKKIKVRGKSGRKERKSRKVKYEVVKRRNKKKYWNEVKRKVKVIWEGKGGVFMQSFLLYIQKVEEKTG